MKKKKIYVLIGIVLFLVTLSISYLLFFNGITSKFIASVNSYSHYVGDRTLSSNYPVINMVYNSSGEDLVNTDISVTIEAKSRYNITKIEYSHDLKNWKFKSVKGKLISEKLIFRNNINKTLYIRVINKKGYKSYAYKTYVKIDKQKPYITHTYKDNILYLFLNDNYGLKLIEYSNDKINWDYELVNGKKISLGKENFGYKYIRVVDKAGNSSNIISIY